jgi:hypothetical protein
MDFRNMKMFKRGDGGNLNLCGEKGHAKIRLFGLRGLGTGPGKRRGRKCVTPMCDTKNQ